ncbi:hypothetical protein IFM89_008415 [Coptis chinensis]|uniref:Mediator complex subunit 15 KIX domain-containing protein n=1 Tax=Coptis chinensis TaxID=261450 RepID=A0A835HDG6_9MAGN|nr:hypothetical protein IFM89_008415 [Coptis chinensis]
MDVTAPDWRTALQPDSRHRIVNKIMDGLKRKVPMISGPEVINELNKIAVMFEEKSYMAADSQSDYLRKISLKMLTVETKFQTTGKQQKTAQAPSTMMQMPGQHSQSQPLLQSLMPQLQPQAGPYQQQLGLQDQLNTLQRDMQQRLHLSGVQLQNVMEQKQIQSQRVLPEASSTSIDSTTQTGNANTAEWQEEAYQKIKAMNDMYLPDLTEMYQKVCAKLQQQEVLTQPKEQIEKLKSLKLYLEHMLHFLQVAKNNIPACYKEKLDSYEKQIGRFLNSHRGKKPIPSHQGQQQLQTSGGHALSMPHQQQPQSQISQLQQHENHMNPQMQPMNIPNSGTSVQPSAVTSMPHGTLPSLSTQLGVPATQANVMSSLQSGSALDMGQGSASSSLQLGGQHTTYHPPQLKPGAQFPISSPQLLPAPSPQHFSPQIDQQNLLTSFPKSGTPLQSANSLFIVPSPSTPLAPSPIPGDSEKQASCISSPSNTGHVGHPQATAALAPAHSLAIGTPGINVFCERCERTDLEDKVDTTHGPAQCSMKGIFISCLIVIVFGFLLSLLAC